MTKETSLTEKTISGLLWVMSGKGSQVILQFIVTIVLARLLTPSDFGVISAALVVITFTSVFSMIGVGPALVQRERINENHIRTGFTITVLLGILFSLLLILTSNLIADFFNIKELKNVLRVLSIVFIINGFSVVSESLMQRDLKFRHYASIEVVSYIAYGIIGVATAFLTNSYWSLVFAYVGNNVVRSSLLIFVERHNMKPKFHYKSFKDLFVYGSGYSIASLTNQFAVQADNIVIGKWVGPAALGLYGRAYQLMVMPANLFGQVLDKVLFPVMSKLQKNKTKLTHLFRIGLTSIALFSIPTSVYIYLLSEEIVLTLFGVKWIELVPILKLLSIGLFFRTGYKLSDVVAKAVGAVYRRTWRQVVYAIAVLTGAYIGQFWGLVGASIGVLCAIVLNYLLMLHLSFKFISLSIVETLNTNIPGIILGVITYISYLFMMSINKVIVLHYFSKLIITAIILLILTIIVLKSKLIKYFGSDVKYLIDKSKTYIFKKQNL